MHQTMEDFIPDIMLVYLDDILIYAKDFGEHLKRLEKVLQRIWEIGLKLNPNKCEFGQLEIEYLGHKISS